MARFVACSGHRTGAGTPVTCRLRKQYGKNLENALPLIIAGNITCLEVPSAEGAQPRRMYKVKAEKSQDIYTVLPHLYCTCESFQNILRRGEDVCVRFYHLFLWLISGMADAFAIAGHLRTKKPGQHVQCKHQITVQVWEALGRCKKQTVADADLSREMMHSIGEC